MSALDPKNMLPAVQWETRQKFQALAKAFEKQTGLRLRVRSGRRTCQEQADLYGIGRTYNLASAPVTYARGCQSWHVLARAIDADPVRADGSVVGDCKTYTLAGQLWEQLGGVWGGRWTQFGACGDAGHFEWHPDVTLAELCPEPAACAAVSSAIVTRSPFAWGWATVAFAGVVIGARYWARRAKMAGRSHGA